MEASVAAMGLDAFFATIFNSHADLAAIPDEERARYLSDWTMPGALTAMLNWYRASDVVVPAVDEVVEIPAWTKFPFPSVKSPTLVIWAMGDTALLPVCTVPIRTATGRTVHCV